MSIPNNYCHLHRQRRGGKCFTSQCAPGSCSSLTFFIREEVSAAHSLKKEQGKNLDVPKWIFPWRSHALVGRGEQKMMALVSVSQCCSCAQACWVRQGTKCQEINWYSSAHGIIPLPLPFYLIYFTLFTLSYLPQLSIQRLTKSSVGTHSKCALCVFLGEKEKNLCKHTEVTDGEPLRLLFPQLETSLPTKRLKGQSRIWSSWLKGCDITISNTTAFGKEQWKCLLWVEKGSAEGVFWVVTVTHCDASCLLYPARKVHPSQLDLPATTIFSLWLNKGCFLADTGCGENHSFISCEASWILLVLPAVSA